MPYAVYQRDGKYRLCNPRTKRVAKNSAGTPLDGGGHSTRESALSQARAMMRAENQRRR